MSARRPSRRTRKRGEPASLSTVDVAERSVNDPDRLLLTFCLATQNRVRGATGRTLLLSELLSNERWSSVADFRPVRSFEPLDDPSRIEWIGSNNRFEEPGWSSIPGVAPVRRNRAGPAQNDAVTSA